MKLENPVGYEMPTSDFFFKQLVQILPPAVASLPYSSYSYKDAYRGEEHKDSTLEKKKKKSLENLCFKYCLHRVTQNCDKEVRAAWYARLLGASAKW